MRKKGNRAYTVILIILLLAAVAAIIIIGAGYVLYRNETEENLTELENKLNKTEESLELLNVERNELYNRQLELIAEKEKLITDFSNADIRYKKLTEEIEQCQSLLSEKDADIEELKANIAKLDTVYSININEQFKILTELNELLENGAPEIEHKEEIKNELGEVIDTIITYEKPHISLCYEDINKGYKFSFNENEVFYSASLVKAPLALSIFMAAENNPEIDFDEKIIYDSDMYRDGSGVLKQSEDGTEYTYMQLMQAMLEYSDNVAYSLLKDRYGLREFSALAARLKLRSMSRSLSDISAADAVMIMKEIYNYTESDGKYSDEMLESMKKGNHIVLIPYAVLPKKSAHKYGWDEKAYHDMAIVYDENPYVVAVLSNLDEGGDEINNYIRRLIKLVDKLHTNFYSENEDEGRK